MAEDDYFEEDSLDVYVAPDVELEEIVTEEFPYLDPTWIILDREPGMDDLAEGATEILKKMGKDLKIYPFQDTDGKDRLFLARFEFPKFEGTPRYPGAVFYVPEGPPPPEGGG